jgi:NAD-dependent deacetylase
MLSCQRRGENTARFLYSLNQYSVVLMDVNINSYEWRRMQVLRASPNAGHLAITDLANYVEQLTVITQNVDDLHERAGSQGVTHLHGSLHKPRCFDCGSSYTFPAGIPDEPAGGWRLKPPVCSQCNGSIRPGVVWFGGVVIIYGMGQG